VTASHMGVATRSAPESSLISGAVAINSRMSHRTNRVFNNT
jgi:hypothetical protein